MKGFPPQVEGPLGPWYQKVNATIRRAQAAETSQQLRDILGESDVVTFVALNDRHGYEDPSEYWDYVDPYRPSFRYQFGISAGGNFQSDLCHLIICCSKRRRDCDPLSMKAASLSLVVIRSKDIDRAKLLYETLGLQFTMHQHGKGSGHFASTIGDVVFEIYPLRDSDHSTTSVRFGFSVESCDDMTRKLLDAGYIARSRPNDAPWRRAAVIEDFDGHKVEIVEKKT